MKNKLDPVKQKLLENIIADLNRCTDEQQARELATQYLDTMQFQAKAEKLKNDLSRKKGLSRVQKLILDVHLSGEGNGVI